MLSVDVVLQVSLIESCWAQRALPKMEGGFEKIRVLCSVDPTWVQCDLW